MTRRSVDLTCMVGMALAVIVLAMGVGAITYRIAAGRQAAAAAAATAESMVPESAGDTAKLEALSADVEEAAARLETEANRSAVTTEPNVEPLLQLARPEHVALVPVVLLIVQFLLRLPPLSEIRSYGSLLAIAVGIGLAMLVGPRNWMSVGSGAIVGLAASMLWKVGHEALKTAARRGSKVAESLTKSSASDGSGYKGFLPLGLCVMLVVLAGGCGAHDFMVAAPAAVQKGLGELEVGVDEYHAAAQAELDQAIDRQKAAFESDLALNFRRVRDGEVKLSDEQLAAEVQKIVEQHHGELSVIRQERANERERRSRMRSLIDWMRRVARQMAEIEVERYATVEELREMANRYVGETLGDGSGVLPPAPSE